MEISYNWLRQYIKLDWSAEEVGNILTSIGLEVEALFPKGLVPGGLEGLVVGEVKTCEKHPNADRLHVTTVDVGGDAQLRIVCGAPNVREGLKVVVAPVGSEIYSSSGESVKIKRSKIRGEESEGMLCAEDEIGVGMSHEGIIELNAHAKVGTPVAMQYPDLCDYVFSIGITANRADALSHYGVARDLAAFFNQKVPTRAQLPEVRLKIGPKSALQVQLENVDTRGCVRYAGITLRGVQVKDSPKWLQERLLAVGLKPICNIVDVTNFVMFELGQPLHAFDLKALPSRRVSVVFPSSGTKFETLDGQVLELNGEDLAICHGATPLCLAGVFGGKASGISEGTADVFLESAVFDPVVIRKTSRRHGLLTDASYRFERGVDPTFTMTALYRAAELILETAGGYVDGDAIDTYPRPLKHDPILFDSQRAYSLMGVTLSRRELETLFEGLEIEYRPVGAGKYELEVPYYRIDVTRMEDVAEELLRLYGYDRVPVTDKMTVALNRVVHSSAAEHQRMLTLKLVGAGFREIMCNSLNCSRDYSASLTYEGKRMVKILNPRSNDLDVLRPTLLLGGLDAIARNINHQRGNLRFFEFGHCYVYDGKDSVKDDALAGYREYQRLGLWLCGELTEGLWNEPVKPLDVYYIKGYCEAVLREAGVEMRNVRFREISSDFLSGAVTISYEKNNEELCRFGEVEPRLLEHFGIKKTVYFAEIACGALEAVWDGKKAHFVDMPNFPEVRRDLALVIDNEVQYAQIEHVALRTAGSLLKRMGLFDVYEGDKIPSGKKSYAVKFILQDDKGTLDDSTIDGCMQRLVSAFAQELGAELRS